MEPNFDRYANFDFFCCFSSPNFVTPFQGLTQDNLIFFENLCFVGLIYEAFS